VILLGWFLNTFEIVFTQMIQRMDSLSYFNFVSHIAKGHIPPQFAHVLGAAHFLAMTKPSGIIHPIVVGEDYINSQVTHYAFNFVMSLQNIFPHTNLESQLRIIVKQ
jgi:hypothetical protein